MEIVRARSVFFVAGALVLAGCRSGEGAGESPPPVAIAPQPPAVPGAPASPPPVPSSPGAVAPGLPASGLPQGVAADITDQEVASVRQALQCGSPEQARYCAAIDAFVAGGPMTLGPGARHGSSMYLAVHPGGEIRRIEEACFLVTGPQGADFGYVIPENPTELAQAATFLAMLRQGVPVPAADPIVAYVRSRAGMASRPTWPAGRSTVVGGAPGDRVYVRQSASAVVLLEAIAPPASARPCYRVGVIQP